MYGRRMRTQDVVEQRDAGGRVDAERKELRRLKPPPAEEHRPVEQQQRKPDQQEVERADWRHLAWTQDSDGIHRPDEEQLIDPEVPAQDIFKRSGEAYESYENRQRVPDPTP